MSADDQREQRVSSLADRIRAHAALSTRPGQLRELEAIADEVEEVEATVERVRALHVSDGTNNPWCDHDGFAWPCPTIRAMDGDR